ncbi:MULTISPECIES: hypothetical protein [Rhodanobacter]|uniref:Transmembrane protein n=2 Tax=Rhodanobacter TaxID=75309 RepID=I4W2X8_9GAMM|nr:hypothetical protein [Rhodanobacter spathiphylli]EIL93819.1 hypothetical protein UU7_06833 [Rhodanobacter spathiphylli B39]
MTRLSNKSYQWQTLLSMSAYVALLLLVWPLARSVEGWAAKGLLALAPVLPMFYLFALMARRIRESDELEQRMHLVALGVATMLTAALSLIGGFLAAAHVLAIDGSILIWVFPVMLAGYGITRSLLVRRYGGDMFACAGDAGIPAYVRALLVAVLMAAVAVFAYVKNDDQLWGVFAGMAAAFIVFAGLQLVRRQRKAALADDRAQR